MYLPICIRSNGAKCLVVGGGAVARRKVELLLRFGCRVTVLAPELCRPLQELHAGGKLEWLPREYGAGDTAGFALVIGATPDRHVNRAVAAEAGERGIPVNIVDDPQLCSFIFPALHRDSDLIVAVSTSATAPFLARDFRDRIRDLAAGWGERLHVGAEFRRVLLAEVRDPARRRALLDRFAAVPFPFRNAPPLGSDGSGEWLQWLEMETGEE